MHELDCITNENMVFEIVVLIICNRNCALNAAMLLGFVKE